MPADQFVVPLDTRVEIAVRDLKAGWTERIEVAASGTGVPEARPEITPDAPPDVAYFAARVGAAAPRSGTTLERAAALRSWACRETVGRVEAETGPDMREQRRERRERPPLMVDDARAVLADVEDGGDANCATAAIVFYDVARAFGLTARRCELHVRGVEQLEAHSTVEIWSSEERRWVVMDPTFDCSYEIDGRPVGALDIHEAVRRDEMATIRVARAAATNGLDPFTYAVNPLLYYRHISIRLGAGTYLERVDAATPPPSPSRVDLIPTSSHTAFREASVPSELLVMRRDAAEGRVAWQVVDGALYVALSPDLFEPERFSVRVEGATPSFLAIRSEFDPTNPSLFASEDYCASSPLEQWSVEGAPRLERSAEGLAVEAGDANCALALALDVEPRTPLVAFAWIRVTEGSVRFVAATRDESDGVTIGPGTALPVSSRIFASRPGATALRLELRAGARCIVERVTMHRALTLAEVAGRAG